MDQAIHNKIVSFIWGIADAIRSGSYLLYDGALGIGGMVTVGEETLLQLATARGQQITTHLYGQEINPETYAICKADMLLKGEGENADHIVGGAEWSTLSHGAFPAMVFDFMMSNPPYGKSWKKDLETMGGKDGMRDPRFKVMHQGEELSLVTRSSDGQLLFLANMASKMNHDTPLGRGNAAVQDFPQCRLRLLESHRRAPAPAAQPAFGESYRVAPLRLRRRRSARPVV